MTENQSLPPSDSLETLKHSIAEVRSASLLLLAVEERAHTQPTLQFTAEEFRLFIFLLTRIKSLSVLASSLESSMYQRLKQSNEFETTTT